MRRPTARVDGDGRIEGAGLSRNPLAIKDIAGAVHDQNVISAVAVDVGHHGRGLRGRGELARVHECTVAFTQEHRDGIG